ncbi:CotD family spore coat protein [Virgibacillus ndiopensis]|uniref:CotD family spore coat protein n=1 Tax=Virgibacillus ndiopensis TaxID=2004408 RepID=UPI000C082544|nr:CotD family spore coat protein [Virgibacillus ndiopensis]
MRRHCNSRRNSVSPAQDEVIVNPTERVVNTRTNRRTVKNIHPTEVENVNRTIIRNEHYYPVSNSEVNETVVRDYDCGSDVNSPNCRRRTSPANNSNRRNCGCKKRGWM